MSDVIFQATGINGDPMIVNMRYVMYIENDADDTAIHLVDGGKIWSIDTVDKIAERIKNFLQGA